MACRSWVKICKASIDIITASLCSIESWSFIQNFHCSLTKTTWKHRLKKANSKMYNYSPYNLYGYLLVKLEPHKLSIYFTKWRSKENKHLHITTNRIPDYHCLWEGRVSWIQTLQKKSNDIEFQVKICALTTFKENYIRSLSFIIVII